MKVWIDQDLCTGDGQRAEIAPDVFFGEDGGLFYVKESAANFGTEKLFDVEECPGECICIEVERDRPRVPQVLNARRDNEGGIALDAGPSG